MKGKQNVGSCTQLTTDMLHKPRNKINSQTDEPRHKLPCFTQFSRGLTLALSKTHSPIMLQECISIIEKELVPSQRMAAFATIGSQESKVKNRGREGGGGIHENGSGREAEEERKGTCNKRSVLYNKNNS